ncbi:hypothetical protein Tco_0826048 [Tanacetum coccineum]
MSVPMTTTPFVTTTESLKDTIHIHLYASDAAQETEYTEEDLQFLRMEKSEGQSIDIDQFGDDVGLRCYEFRAE